MVADENAIASALNLLRQGEGVAAERTLRALEAGGDPRVLHALGTIRMRQHRFPEAESLFIRARAAAPQQPQIVLALGRALAEQGRDAEAIDIFQSASALTDARYELGSTLQRLGRLDEAERAFRDLLATAPAHAPAYLALGGVLIETKRPAEAEAVMRAGLVHPAPPRLAAMLHTNLGLALRHQRRDAEALAAYDQAAALEPALPGLDIHRAEALQNLGRYDEALDTYRKAIAGRPGDAQAHRLYNDLLYRLKRDDYLSSYNNAPPTRALLLGRAQFLSQERRGEECLAIHRELLSRDANDPRAALGVAEALTLMNRPQEAVSAYDAVLSRHGGDAPLHARAAQAALLARDPERALRLTGQGLELARHDQACLAMTGLALRMLQDERDEILNGYDRLIRVFDLEPPQGFSSMEHFNAELNAWLDRLHPDTREFVNQSLRGGTQTPDHVFGAGHGLVDRLESRIREAVARYVAELKDSDNVFGAAHPFLSRRARDFRYVGSWSSRLRDCGFHVNHIHPEGWISSCYYIAVPDAVKDEGARQGWIKFGEPGFDVGLGSRRSVQPVPGRLVLFPSYMWHGTIPFHD
ncbi:MAG TPA: tetratricopeptide repeat protein, partial [Rhizomicrobium sp.]|nr:tetratricopeptide repeat protein [Rhizomicrobium sp.]